MKRLKGDFLKLCDDMTTNCPSLTKPHSFSHRSVATPSRSRPRYTDTPQKAPKTPVPAKAFSESLPQVTTRPQYTDHPQKAKSPIPAKASNETLQKPTTKPQNTDPPQKAPKSPLLAKASFGTSKGPPIKPHKTTLLAEPGSMVAQDHSRSSVNAPSQLSSGTPRILLPSSPRTSRDTSLPIPRDAGKLKGAFILSVKIIGFFDPAVFYFDKVTLDFSYLFLLYISPIFTPIPLISSIFPPLFPLFHVLPFPL